MAKSRCRKAKSYIQKGLCRLAELGAGRKAPKSKPMTANKGGKVSRRRK